MLVFCKQFIGAFSVKKLIVLIGFLMCLDARAGIIDFDDSFIAGVGLGTVAGPSNSYEGFSWSYIHSLTNFPNTGYALVQQGAPGRWETVKRPSANDRFLRQTSVCSASSSASSTSTPRYRTVLSSFVCPSSNCTARRFFVLL
jgi:hypothetical protein